MEGKILSLYKGSYRKLVSDKTRVSVEIEFTDKEQIDRLFLDDENDEDEDNSDYIGHIELIEDYDDPDIGICMYMKAKFTLPNNMFLYLRGLQETNITLETIHDYLTSEPTDTQKVVYGNHLVAFIKRVHFKAVCRA